jgi:hypothetical protein
MDGCGSERESDVSCRVRVVVKREGYAAAGDAALGGKSVEVNAQRNQRHVPHFLFTKPYVMTQRERQTRVADDKVLLFSSPGAE